MVDQPTAASPTLEAMADHGHERSWERWKVAWQHAFFATALALVTLGAVTGAGHDVGAVGLRVGLAATLAGWYAYWIGVRAAGGKGGGETGGRVPAAYLPGAAALWAVMAAVDPALLPVGLAVLAPYCLRHALWSVGGVVVGGAWLWQRSTSAAGLDLTAVLGCGLGLTASVTIAGYIATLDRENRKRQRLLDELTAAQAKLAAAERREGILAERQRLARDIHDTLTQGFASIAMLLDAARDDLPEGSPVARRIEQAMRTARDNHAESRRLVHALRPPRLEGTHLADAVRELTARLAEETGINAHTVVTGRQTPLAAATETELLRVVQEALTNVRRHADATNVTVTLTYLDDVLAIDVTDDGVGFDPAAGPAGVGLTAMRERIDALGGTLTVESAVGDGTALAVATPLPDGCTASEPSASGPGTSDMADVDEVTAP